MNIVICQRPSSASEYAQWVRGMMPNARIVVLTQEDSMAERVNRHFAQVETVGRYDGEEFDSALSRLAKDGADRIICNSENDVVRVAEVRSRYSIPGMNYNLSICFRDKLKMKTLFTNAGTPIGPFSGVRSVEQVQNFMNSSGECVLKPRCGAGAIGVHLFSDTAEMVRLFNDQKVRDGLDRGDLIIEKFLPGDVYHADVLVESDRVLFLSVSRYVHKPYRFNKENYGSVMLDDSPKRYEISEVVAKFVRSLPRGHEVHVLHFEFIDDAENRATCGEVAARVGGGLIKQSIRYSFGIDMSQEFCRLELGLRAKIDSPNTRSLTGWLVRTGGPNLRVPARDLEWVVECKDDGVTKIPIDAADFAGTAIVTGRDELERRRHLSMLENLEACNNE